MKEFIENIGSYNLFNFLLPGVIFSVIMEETNTFNYLPENIIALVFVCYFIGMVISIFGSQIVEPFLKKIKFIKFKDYSSFVVASRKDSKLDKFSEQNNSYRTLIAMIIMIMLAKFYRWSIDTFDLIKSLNIYIILCHRLTIGENQPQKK